MGTFDASKSQTYKDRGQEINLTYTTGGCQIALGTDELSVRSSHCIEPVESETLLSWAPGGWE